MLHDEYENLEEEVKFRYDRNSEHFTKFCANSAKKQLKIEANKAKIRISFTWTILEHQQRLISLLLLNTNPNFQVILFEKCI